MIETSVVTTKGQVVIPRKIRVRFHIKKGTRVCFELGGGEIILKPQTSEYFEKMAGFLGTRGKVLRAFLEEKKKEREL